MKPLKMSNYKIVAWLTFLVIIIKTNTIKANPEASSSTSVNDDRSMVELSFECRNLHSGDRLSKSDPFVVVSLHVPGQSAWYKIGNTESIKNSHNPTFTQVVVATHIFEEKQLLKFDVYDKDRSNMDILKLHTFLGSAEESLGTLIRKRTTELTLINTKKSTSSSTNAGTIIIKAKEYGEDKGKVTLGLNGFNLDAKNSILGGGGSDPYIEIQKCNIESNNTENCVTVKKTESIKGNNTDPQWATFNIPVWLLCDGSYNRKLKFICWDYNTTLKDSYIGEFNVTLNDLIKQYQNTSTASFHLINHKKQKKEKNYSNSGVIQVHTFSIGPSTTLLDFLQTGTQIHAVVSIDFTASNGDPKEKTSHHHIKAKDKNYWNNYEQAIWSVVSVIEDYDTDKQIPAFGFGARFGQYEVSHLFNVNNKRDPNCYGASGVLEAYREFLQTVNLDGPTYFSPTINHVIELARKVDKGKGYYILLIITDGVVSDGPDTEKAIAVASKLPISIIIVGVGGGDFTKMRKMAAHERLLIDASGQPVRDIVHFVEFQGDKKFNKNIGSSELAKDVLAEIPQQFLDYMKLNGIGPTNKVTYQDYYVEH